MILGIDSAPNLTGWALVERQDRERIVRSGTLNTVTGPVVTRFVEEMAVIREHIEVVVIEDAYLSRVAQNVDTLKALCKLIGRWQQEFDRVRIPYRLVMADVWQRGLLTGLIAPSTRGPARKVACQLWVQSTFGACLGPDEADAVGLATWECRQRHFAKRAGLRPK